MKLYWKAQASKWYSSYRVMLLWLLILYIGGT